MDDRECAFQSWAGSQDELAVGFAGCWSRVASGNGEGSCVETGDAYGSGAGPFLYLGKVKMLTAANGDRQVMLGYEFLAAHPRSYLTRAFEFSRQFMFKWTVNWRFVGEDTFLSRPFSIGLLATHAALILVFLQPRWLKPAGVDWQTLPRWVLRLYTPPAMVEERISRRVTPAFILTSILSAITIGCLCARSLHYQFYAYLAWSTPFLLWRSGLHPILVCFVWAVQEWAWNVYPSTNVSSAVVVACLAVSTGASWVALDKSDALLPAKKST